MIVYQTKSPDEENAFRSFFTAAESFTLSALITSTSLSQYTSWSASTDQSATAQGSTISTQRGASGGSTVSTWYSSSNNTGSTTSAGGTSGTATNSTSGSTAFSTYTDAEFTASTATFEDEYLATIAYISSCQVFYPSVAGTTTVSQTTSSTRYFTSYSNDVATRTLTVYSLITTVATRSQGINYLQDTVYYFDDHTDVLWTAKSTLTGVAGWLTNVAESFTDHLTLYASDFLSSSSASAETHSVTQTNQSSTITWNATTVTQNNSPQTVTSSIRTAHQFVAGLFTLSTQGESFATNWATASLSSNNFNILPNTTQTNTSTTIGAYSLSTYTSTRRALTTISRTVESTFADDGLVLDRFGPLAIAIPRGIRTATVTHTQTFIEVETGYREGNSSFLFVAAGTAARGTTQWNMPAISMSKITFTEAQTIVEELPHFFTYICPTNAQGLAGVETSDANVYRSLSADLSPELSGVIINFADAMSMVGRGGMSRPLNMDYGISALITDARVRLPATSGGSSFWATVDFETGGNSTRAIANVQVASTAGAVTLGFAHQSAIDNLRGEETTQLLNCYGGLQFDTARAMTAIPPRGARRVTVQRSNGDSATYTTFRTHRSATISVPGSVLVFESYGQFYSVANPPTETPFFGASTTVFPKFQVENWFTTPEEGSGGFYADVTMPNPDRF